MANPLWEVSKLTLSNLQPSDKDKLAFLSLSKEQRLALYNLCTILFLTSEKSEDRESAKKLRELIRLNTLDPKHNACEFDKTAKEKKLDANPLRSTKHDS